MWDLVLKLLGGVEHNYYENQPQDLPIEVRGIDKNKEKRIGEYSILQGHPLESGKRWSTEWLLSEYVKNTDALIGKMDGTIPMENQTIFKVNKESAESNDKIQLIKEQKDLPPPTAAIYLDKSARPVSWLKRSLWDELARVPGTRYSDGQVPEQPKDYFINLDKMDWLRRMGVEEKHLEDASDVDINYEKISKQEIARIRALFSTEEIHEENLDEAWNHPTIFDGQHVMVVDEVASSGQSLEIAQKLLSMAVPEGTFSAYHWARPKRVGQGVSKDGKPQFKVEWVPVWYIKDVEGGRGIGDKDVEWPERSVKPNEKINYHPSRYAKVGRNILSTPPHDAATDEIMHDQLGDRLRDDIKQLKKDLAEGNIFYRPSAERDDFEERIEEINGMSFQEWRKKRDELEPKAR